MLDILDINTSVLHDCLSKPIGSISYYVQYIILPLCSYTPDKKFKKTCDCESHVRYFDDREHPIWVRQNGQVPGQVDM